eukprot:TRINITY_DN5342_c0_g2_i1.p1 TRINITY_DN5342_c0_g2~~TRINITY_DN5342_c0_g2_i1.p1  ORF type:complete len:771 (+),score=76.71 TRINITY_DN5342_c0_g2_i1:54-2315(+)
MAYEMIRILLLLGILRSGMTSRMRANLTQTSSSTSRLSDFIETGRWMELFEKGSSAQKVGEGSFGVVKRAKLIPECNSSKPIVVKEIDLVNYRRKTKSSLKESIKQIANELKTQIELGDHPNIMGIYDYAPRHVQDWTDKVYIMMPEARGGDLDKLYETELRKNGIDPGANKTAVGKLWGQMLEYVGLKDHQQRNTLIAHIAVDVTRGLVHVHEHNFVHMDIKPGNVWASDMNCLRRPAGCKYMLGDFGLTANEKEARNIRAGTPYFMPPEVGGVAKDELYGRSPVPANVKGWSKAGDVFSLGLTLLFLISMKGTTLWSSFGRAIMKNPANVLSENVEGLPPLLAELISGMLLADPRKRITAAKAHELAQRAYLEVTGREVLMPALYTIPSCVTQCNAMKCCHMHHCSMSKRTCQLDKPQSQKPEGIQKALGDALAAIQRWWTTSAAATPVLKNRFCYGHGMGPSEMSQDKKEVQAPESRRAAPGMEPTKPVAQQDPRARLFASPKKPEDQADILRVGSAVKYFSSSYRQWIDCVVVNTRESEATRDAVDIQLDCKAGYWMNPDEQAQKVRAADFVAPVRELQDESKPRYAQGSSVQLFSSSLGLWTDCNVVGVKAAQINLDCLPEQWLSLEDQRTRVRERPPPPAYVVGSEVQYYSVSYKAWGVCQVTAKQADQIQLSCKPGKWLSLADQQPRLQPKYKNGDRVRYHSASQGRWLQCSVASSDPAGNIWLSDDCGSVFLDIWQQKLNLVMEP